MIGTFIKRPVFTTMFVLLLVVFGIRCYPEIGVDLNPDVDLPIVSVRVRYDGASPEEMETLVTKPIENRVSQVSGIKTLSSTVLEGYSETVLEFNLGVDPQQKASEVREKVSSIRKSLPDDIDEPTTQTVDLNARAIVAWTFSSSSRSRGEIRRIIEDNIKDELQMVEGVSEVTVVGASQRCIRIVLKPEKLQEYGISYQTVRDTINKNNYNTPGGKARSQEMEITVRTLAKYNTVDDIKKVVDEYGMYANYAEEDKMGYDADGKRKHTGCMGEDFVYMVEDGIIERDSIVQLGEIIRGKKEGRTSRDEVILVSIEGMPVEDVAWGYECYQRAKELGIGTSLKLWDAPRSF